MAPLQSRNRSPTWQCRLALALLALSLLALSLLAIGAARPAAADTAAGLDALVRHDYMTAIAELQPPAQAGDARAQVSLAGIYHYGLGIPANFAKALRWYRAAAMQGNPDAQLGLAVMYAFGQGVPVDRAAAHSWLTIALDAMPPGDDRDRVQINRDALTAQMTRAELQQSADLVRAWYSTHRKR